MTFFELSSPRHMLEKAHREHARLRQCVDIDNVFNFFVTAYHILDYVKKLGSVPKSDVKTFSKDQDIEDCGDLCNKGKHVILDRDRPDPSTRITRNSIGGGMVGEMMVGAEDMWFLETGGRKVDVMRLAERILQKWEAFFATHSL